MLATTAELKTLLRYEPQKHSFLARSHPAHGSIIPCSLSLSQRGNALACRIMSSSLKGAGCHSHPALSCKLHTSLPQAATQCLCHSASQAWSTAPLFFSICLQCLLQPEPVKICAVVQKGSTGCQLLCSGCCGSYCR